MFKIQNVRKIQEYELTLKLDNKTLLDVVRCLRGSSNEKLQSVAEEFINHQSIDIT